MSEYRRRLEAELASLTRRRIGLRGFLEAVSKGWQWGGIEHTLRQARVAQQELRGSEYRYGELKHILGIRDLPVVKLDVPTKPAAAHRGAVNIRTAAQDRKLAYARSGAVLTRMVGGPGCR